MQLETLRETPGSEHAPPVDELPPVGFSRMAPANKPFDLPESHLPFGNDATPGVIVIGESDEIRFVGGAGKGLEKLLEKQFETPRMEEDRRRLLQTLKYLRLVVLKKTKCQRLNRTVSMPEALFTFQEKTIICRGLLLEGNQRGEQMVLILIEHEISEKKPPSRSSFFYTFTPREKSVLKHVRQGLTNREISAVLGIGVHTVKDHVKRIMKKVNVHTRSGIVGMVCAT